MVTPPANLATLEALKEIVSALRGPQGCPWDKEQTPQTLTRFVVEEAFELAEAIDSRDRSAIVEELGDYLFQVALQVQIAQEHGEFDWTDILSTLNEKMVRRHPHVFGSETAATPEEVLVRWNELKKEEKAKDPKTSKRQMNVSSGLPAILRSQKIGDKSNQVRFDWVGPREVFEKVREEWTELQEAFAKLKLDTKQNAGNAALTNDIEHVREELGDMMFTLVQLARHLNFDAEATLRASNSKFETRFNHMLEFSNLTLEEFKDLPDADKEQLWSRAKSVK